MVLQLCGRVCRRLSFENPVSNETGFFVLHYFVFFTAKGAKVFLYFVFAVVFIKVAKLFVANFA